MTVRKRRSTRPIGPLRAPVSLKFLIYSGAGQIGWGAMMDAAMQFPVCGTNSDDLDAIKRNDSAVVEFSVSPSGEVINAMTVYAS